MRDSRPARSWVSGSSVGENRALCFWFDQSYDLRSYSMKIEQEYLSATETQLATLEQLCERKRSSKGDIFRQRMIVRQMLQVCREIDPLIRRPAQYVAVGLHWGRVLGVLDQAKTEPEGLVGAIDRYILEARP